MSFIRSPIMSPIELQFMEDFNNSIQKNTTNESYSMTEKGTLAFTTSNKKFTTSFDEVNSNGKFEITTGNMIEFEEFNPISKEINNRTGNFGKAVEENKKNNEISFACLKELEKKNENLIFENEELKKKLILREKEIESLKENMIILEKNKMLSPHITKLEKKNEDLLKEILILKQNLMEMNQNCKDTDIENIKLKEEIENKGEKVQKLIEKIKELEKFLIFKEQKIENFSKDLNRQNFNDNENLAQKNLLYCEKLNQMGTLVEAQKQIIQKNEKKIESLIKKIDELASSNKLKADEISKLKYETSSLKNEIENLNNRFFIKNYQKHHNDSQKEIYKQERIISNLDENLDNFETNKNIEILIKNKRNANNSNHLTHASLNFELNSLAGNRFPETSQLINDYRSKEFSTNLPLRSPEIITKISSQKNLEYQTNEKNFAKGEANLHVSEIHRNLSKRSINKDEMKVQTKSPLKKTSSNSVTNSKCKEKNSLNDLNYLVNQIANKRPPKNENVSNTQSKLEISGKLSNVSKSNKSSSSVKYSNEVANNIEKKSSGKIKNVNNEKENIKMKTDRVSSSDFKNFNNLKAPLKMFANKNQVLLNNYLKNEMEYEEYSIRNRNSQF